MPGELTAVDRRVLILPPTSRDGEACCRLIGDAGLDKNFLGLDSHIGKEVVIQRGVTQAKTRKGYNVNTYLVGWRTPGTDGPTLVNGGRPATEGRVA